MSTNEIHKNLERIANKKDYHVNNFWLSREDGITEIRILVFDMKDSDITLDYEIKNFKNFDCLFDKFEKLLPSGE